MKLYNSGIKKKGINSSLFLGYMMRKLGFILLGCAIAITNGRTIGKKTVYDNKMGRVTIFVMLLFYG